jgi:hypothetical protein
VLKVPAYSNPLGKYIQRGLGGAGMLIAKGYLGINPTADGPDPGPAWSHIAKQLHCYVGEAIDLAVAAIEQEDEHIVGQLFGRNLAGVVGDWVRQARVFDQRRIPHAKVTGRRQESRADVAVAVTIFPRRHSAVVHDEDVRFAEVSDAAGMHMKLGHIRERAWQVKLKVIT